MSIGKQSSISPFELMALLMGAGLTMYVILILAVFFLKRALAWLDNRYWFTYGGHVPTYRSLGNAFLEIQSLTDPRNQYVLEEQVQGEVNADLPLKGTRGRSPEPADVPRPPDS